MIRTQRAADEGAQENQPVIEARTDVIGSLLRPPELLEAQRLHAAGELSAEETARAVRG